jgi:hypothetical protein
MSGMPTAFFGLILAEEQANRHLSCIIEEARQHFDTLSDQAEGLRVLLSSRRSAI